MQCMKATRGTHRCRCRSIWKRMRTCNRILEDRDSPKYQPRVIRASTFISIPTRISIHINHNPFRSPFRVPIVLVLGQQINTTRIRDNRCMQSHLVEDPADQQEMGTAHCNNRVLLGLRDQPEHQSRHYRGDGITASTLTFGINPQRTAGCNSGAEWEHKTRRTDSKGQRAPCRVVGMRMGSLQVRGMGSAMERIAVSQPRMQTGCRDWALRERRVPRWL
jgi:hypothetical protein